MSKSSAPKIVSQFLDKKKEHPVVDRMLKEGDDDFIDSLLLFYEWLARRRLPQSHTPIGSIIP